MMELIFWTSLLLILYIYFGYPLVVNLVGLFRALPVRRHADHLPIVTVLIAAFNEEDVIEATVRNKLAQDYPADRLDILVVSDGSSDRTDGIVKEIADPRVRLLRQEPRAGKTSALNLAVPEAQGEIIVFSDANSLYASDALRQLVANFADPEVGYVTGKMLYANPDGSITGEGCSTYMKYENALRVAETRIGSVVGVDGGIDAVRRELYVPMNSDQLPDFILPLHVVKQGYRVVYEPRAILWESSLKEAGDEYQMRVRVSLRAFWALFDMRGLLLFKQNPLFAWQLWSHKVLRYLCFIFLTASLLSSFLLLDQGLFFFLFFFLQAGAYIGALVMPSLERKGFKFNILIFIHYFALLNLASAHAFGKFISGRKQVVWTPRKG
jgi:cellulose synthase/poly-beta-1,6-N-acetylglucosamine synthase-like glycosyltransferase